MNKLKSYWTKHIYEGKVDDDEIQVYLKEDVDKYLQLLKQENDNKNKETDIIVPFFDSNKEIDTKINDIGATIELKRSDLLYWKQNTEISKIRYDDFKLSSISKNQIRKAFIITFVDDNGERKNLKEITFTYNDDKETGMVDDTPYLRGREPEQ